MQNTIIELLQENKMIWHKSLTELHDLTLIEENEEIKKILVELCNDFDNLNTQIVSRLSM